MSGLVQLKRGEALLWLNDRLGRWVSLGIDAVARTNYYQVVQAVDVGRLGHFIGEALEQEADLEARGNKAVSIAPFRGPLAALYTVNREDSVMPDITINLGRVRADSFYASPPDAIGVEALYVWLGPGVCMTIVVFPEGLGP